MTDEELQERLNQIGPAAYGPVFRAKQIGVCGLCRYDIEPGQIIVRLDEPTISEWEYGPGRHRTIKHRYAHKLCADGSIDRAKARELFERP